jgi:hypothetical protein
MYEIELLDGKRIWMNERVIMKVVSNDDDTLTIYHFNNSILIIKSIKINDIMKLN